MEFKSEEFLNHIKINLSNLGKTNTKIKLEKNFKKLYLVVLILYKKI